MGDAVISVSLSGPVLDRLAALAESYGVEPDVMLGRLMDRDPHDHDHRCPTCARLADAHAQQVAAIGDDQPVLPGWA